MAYLCFCKSFRSSQVDEIQFWYNVALVRCWYWLAFDSELKNTVGSRTNFVQNMLTDGTIRFALLNPDKRKTYYLETSYKPIVSNDVPRTASSVPLLRYLQQHNWDLWQTHRLDLQQCSSVSPIRPVFWPVNHIFARYIFPDIRFLTETIYFVSIYLYFKSDSVSVWVAQGKKNRKTN